MKKKIYFIVIVIFIFMLSILAFEKKQQVNLQKPTTNVVATDSTATKTPEVKKEEVKTPETPKTETSQTENNTKPQTTPAQKPVQKPTTNPTVNSPKVSELMGKVLSSIKFNDMTDLDSGTIKDLYGINTEELEEYSVKVPLMNVKATEIAILKVKDEKKVQDIKNGIMNRQKKLEKSWEHYLPDQYDLVKNYTLEVKGKYIIFIIHEDAQKAKEIFIKELK